MEIWCFHSSTKIKQLCCWCSIAQLCLTLCDPMDRNTPRFPVHHQFPELAQTHVHWVGDAIQPSHPLSSPSPPDFYLSQHQSLFKHVDALHQVAKILELQHQSFHWIFRVDFLYDRLVWSPWCSRNCQESSPAPQFIGSSLTTQECSHSLIWLIWILHLSSPSDWSKYHHMIQIRLPKMLWLKSLHASLGSSCHAYASVEWEMCKKENKQKWWMERNRAPKSSRVYSSLKSPFDFTSTFFFFAYLGSYLASDTCNQNIST